MLKLQTFNLITLNGTDVYCKFHPKVFNAERNKKVSFLFPEKNLFQRIDSIFFSFQHCWFEINNIQKRCTLHNTEIQVIVRGSLDSFGGTVKINWIFPTTLPTGGGGGVQAQMFVQYFKTIKVNINRCQKFNHRNDSPTRTAVNNQLRQRHLSTLYTIKELCETNGSDLSPITFSETGS